MITKFHLFENYIRIESYNDNTDKNRYDYIDMDIIKDTFVQLTDEYDNIEIGINDITFFKCRLKRKILPDEKTRITNFSIYKLIIKQHISHKPAFVTIPMLREVIIQSLNNYYDETKKELFCFFIDTTIYGKLNFCRIEVLDMVNDLHEDYEILTKDTII